MRPVQSRCVYCGNEDYRFAANTRCRDCRTQSSFYIWPDATADEVMIKCQNAGIDLLKLFGEPTKELWEQLRQEAQWSDLREAFYQKLDTEVVPIIDTLQEQICREMDLEILAELYKSADLSISLTPS